jgi:outer membrane murein-binding lipoprotein Lpp
MKKSLFVTVAMTLLLCGCHSLQKKEQLLSTAGFRSITPATAAQAAHLKTLPQDHLIPVTKHGQTLFILADAKQNRLYIGNQSQYTAYKQLRLQKQLARDEAATTDLNADANAEWAAWGGLESPLWSPNF